MIITIGKIASTCHPWSFFESNEFHSAIAETIEEARKLVEDGFEYVCQKEEIMLFRKRKWVE